MREHCIFFRMRFYHIAVFTAALQVKKGLHNARLSTHFIWKNNSAKLMNMKCYLSGTIQELFGLYFLHIEKLNIQPFWRCLLINTDEFCSAVDRFTDMYRYLPIYRLSADISVLQIRKMLIGIGNRYRPIRRPISVALQIWK